MTGLPTGPKEFLGRRGWSSPANRRSWLMTPVSQRPFWASREERPMAESNPTDPIDLAAVKRQKRLRARLHALLSEPETQLLMRADKVDSNELLNLLLRAANGLPATNGNNHKRGAHVRMRGLKLLQLLVEMKKRFQDTDG